MVRGSRAWNEVGRDCLLECVTGWAGSAIRVGWGHSLAHVPPRAAGRMQQARGALLQTNAISKHVEEKEDSFDLCPARAAPVQAVCHSSSSKGTGEVSSANYEVGSWVCCAPGVQWVLGGLEACIHLRLLIIHAPHASSANHEVRSYLQLLGSLMWWFRAVLVPLLTMFVTPPPHAIILPRPQRRLKSAPSTQFLSFIYHSFLGGPAGAALRRGRLHVHLAGQGAVPPPHRRALRLCQIRGSHGAGGGLVGHMSMHVDAWREGLWGVEIGHTPTRTNLAMPTLHLRPFSFLLCHCTTFETEYPRFT